MSKLQVRLISPWTECVETEVANFSTKIATDKADALLCEWAPSPELDTFPRRKAWYCCEPQCQFQRIEGSKWPRIKKQLGTHEFLYHGHSDPRFRVPHITHFQPLTMNRNLDRKERAIAIVSNHGGSPLRRHPDIAYRNHLITDPLVDLYGRSGWKSYRAAWYHLAGAPANYKGEIQGDWPADQKRMLMSQYKVCVCLENMNEPGYFTEKFVEAVVAGCIPVFRAAADIRETFLKGACWFDPGDFSSPCNKAIKAALGGNLKDCQEINSRWLKESLALRSTHSQEVFNKIATILAESLSK
jgi:hypothetical protein